MKNPCWSTFLQGFLLYKYHISTLSLKSTSRQNIPSYKLYTCRISTAENKGHAPPSTWLTIYCICTWFPDSKMHEYVITDAFSQTHGNLRCICNDCLRRLRSHLTVISSVAILHFVVIHISGGNKYPEWFPEWGGKGGWKNHRLVTALVWRR